MPQGVKEAYKSTQDSKSVSSNQTGALGTVMGASKYTP